MIIEKTESDQYGTYYLECVGILDFPLMAEIMDADEMYAWMEKYHPRGYRGFSAWGLRLIKNGPKEDFIERGFNVYAVMVPTRRVNENWSPEGTRCQRQSGSKKYRYLPVAATCRDVEKWQSSLSILVPKWFHEANNFDDLQEKFYSAID